MCKIQAAACVCCAAAVAGAERARRQRRCLGFDAAFAGRRECMIRTKLMPLFGGSLDYSADTWQPLVSSFKSALCFAAKQNRQLDNQRPLVVAASARCLRMLSRRAGSACISTIYYIISEWPQAAIRNRFSPSARCKSTIDWSAFCKALFYLTAICWGALGPWYIFYISAVKCYSGWKISIDLNLNSNYSRLKLCCIKLLRSESA